MYNTLVKASVKIPRDTIDVEQLIVSAFSDIEYIYSYIVYAKYKQGKLQYWQVDFMLSQHDKYNCHNILDVAKRVAAMTELSVVNETRKILGYEQPGPEILLKVYEPLVKRLAQEEHNRWNYLDFEDLLQMCRLVIMRLYRNGYYIHKSLVKRAFTNEVLLHIRKDKNKPIIVSIEESMYNNSSDNDISILESIIDESSLLEQEEFIEQDELDKLNARQRQLIVDKIGQRQYDQLVREYGNKMTTSWSRKTIQTLKNYLRRIGEIV